MCILVVCPLSTNGWQSFLSDGDSEDVDFIAELIQSLQASHSTPVENVIITGFSFGGSMSYRVWCERSDVVTGIVSMGQTFFEPSVGHLGKGGEVAGQTATETVLDMMTAARQTSDKCDPEFKRPHYAVVGTTDEYYGEVGGTYTGKLLWERMSTTVLGCTGNPTGDDGATITVDASNCFEYPSCEALTASLNKYCSVEGRGHSTDHWQTTVWAAFADFFSVTSPLPEETSGGSGEDKESTTESWGDNDDSSDNSLAISSSRVSAKGIFGPLQIACHVVLFGAGISFHQA